MTRTRQRQLELPVMVNVNEKASTGSEVAGIGSVSLESTSLAPGFHRPASIGDQSIYKAISDNYFEGAVKQA